MTHLSLPLPSSPPSLRVCIQHVPVCAFKMSPCVPATCPHVLYMWACCRYTRERFERTHGDVLNAHTEVFSVPHHNKHHTTHNHTHHTTHTTNTTRTQHITYTQQTTAPHYATHCTHARHSHLTHHTPRHKPHTTHDTTTRTHTHTHTNTHLQHTRTTIQQVQTLNCLIKCPPSGN